ncbi:hypothetical protein DCAR_0312039 [Daucus carota subsp. sativus]|uniref:F-box domain-containing protein n=1 Tax=Daucus carota subsp. sativus TaxID=79200 RepID=A0AAF0WQQ2_DAUCS|nr:PREDICTED: F-box/kelch-repeat protein At3g23880-like [Daucus carota subsp. sativus]WOG92763.1 hypothetical protein DCAR_0312039 [Daucus carota subsp. sativus]
MADSLPPDMLSEIFKRLPVNHVLRCMCVKKSWYRVIKTCIFVSLHLNYRQSVSSKRYLLFHSNYSGFSVHSDDKKCRETYKWRPDDVGQTSYGTSNGLICLSDLELEYDSHIYLWNPAIRRSKLLPPSSLFLDIFKLEFKGKVFKMSLAFGYSSSRDDYKVVKVMIYCLEKGAKWLSLVDVYSLRSNSWKEIGQEVSCCKLGRPVFVKGVVYWIAKKCDGKRLILCFDTEEEVFREILLPGYDCAYKLDHFVQKFGELLCVLVFHPPSEAVDMWVMEEAEVWRKITSIGLADKYGLPMGFRNNGEMVLRMLNYEFGFVSYDLKRNKPTGIMKSKHLKPFGWDFSDDDEKEAVDNLDQKVYFVNPFMESLVLLDDK